MRLLARYAHPAGPRGAPGRVVVHATQAGGQTLCGHAPVAWGGWQEREGTAAEVTCRTCRRCMARRAAQVDEASS